MKRIEEKFSTLAAKNEKALIVYLTAGDPSLDITRKLIFALEKAGADILEIGVPFSDPTADGPVIQAASQRSLKAGTTLEGVLKMVADVRKVSEIPIVLFGYFNPILAYGVKKFAHAARNAGGMESSLSIFLMRKQVSLEIIPTLPELILFPSSPQQPT